MTVEYKRQTDMKINAAVECELDGRVKHVLYEDEDQYLCSVDGEDGFFEPRDFCNNPSDALPIILENKISIAWVGSYWQVSAPLDYCCIGEVLKSKDGDGYLMISSVSRKVEQ